MGAEVVYQSNSGLQQCSTLGAWVCRAGLGAGARVKSRFTSSTLFLSLLDPVFLSCSHTGAGFSVGDIDVKACEGLLESVLEAFHLPAN